jgi:UPF0755 protein
MTPRLFRGWMGRLAGGLLLLLVLAVAALAWAWHAWTGPGPAAPAGQPALTLVNIPTGMTLGAAADTLVGRGLLRDRRVLLAGARLSGQDRQLRAGLYELAYGSSARQLLTDLTSGLSVQVKVTIPEGLDAASVAAIVAREMEFPAEAFLAVADSLVAEAARGGLLGGAEQAARHEILLQDASSAGTRRFHWCEGYLAPDTYHFSVGTDPAAVAAHLVSTQFSRLDSLFAAGPVPNGQVGTPHQLLTLASIVEAEARRDDERAQVAAVYTNRLAQRWRLEADPTVAFVLDKKGQRLFYRDLEVDSPFNTYRNRGLPPGPIGSPGWKSLEAAASPDTACAAMYFVSDGADGHVFSRTAREHQEAVRRFRQVRAQQRRQGER